MPAGNTYEPIATATITGSSTNSVIFTSIPQTYTDLVLVASSRSASASSTQRIYTFENSNFSVSRSVTWMFGNGSSASSSRQSGVAVPFGYIASNADASNVFSTTVINYFNYSNTTTFKTSISRSSSAGFSSAFVQLFPSTAAISELYISNDANNNWVAGSTFSLYGIKSA